MTVRSFAAGAFPQIVPIAADADSAADLKAKVKGMTDVLTAELLFEAGGDTGWHIHPGPVAVIVKSGNLTEYQANSCKTDHPAADSGSGSRTGRVQEVRTPAAKPDERPAHCEI